MINTDMLRQHVPPRIYARGVNYYNQNRIQNYKVKEVGPASFKITANVKGGRIYNVEVNVELEEGDLLFHNYCDCPYDWGDVCKHVVAVLYRFLEEDYPELEQEVEMNRDYQKLVEFSGANDRGTPRLHYYIKGMADQNLKNFKLIIDSEYISDYNLQDLVERLNNDYYTMIDESEFKELLTSGEVKFIKNFNYLQKQKGREGNSLLLEKSPENFEFLLELIDEYEVFHAQNQRRLDSGDTLKPELTISGDSRLLYFRVNADYTIYNDDRERLQWTVIDNVVHPVDLSGLSQLPPDIEVPADKKGEMLFEVIPRLREKMPLKVEGELAKYELIKEEPEVRLDLDYRDEQIYCQVRVNLGGDSYHNSEILGLELERNEYVQDEDDPYLWQTEDKEALQRVVEFFEDYNFRVNTDCFFIKNGEDIREFITDGLVHIPEEWTVTTTPAFDNIEVDSVELEPIIEVEEGGDINWFDFTISYNLGGETYTRAELKQMISYNKQGEPYIKQGDTYYMLEYGSQEDRVEQMLEAAEKTETGYRSRTYNLLYYKKVAEEAGLTFEQDRVYDEENEDITGDKAVSEVPVPGPVQEKLRDYQKRGYYWLRFLHRYNFGGVLADDMGLGKTLQVLTLIKSLELPRPALVVCPRSLIYNWQEEADKFYPGLNCLVYYGSPEDREELQEQFQEYELIVTSYSIVSRDQQQLNEENHRFSYVILDEAQHIKNHQTKRARAVKNLTSPHRLALTGTPLENSVSELWSIFDFLMPGYLGNYNYFRKKYLNPINKNNDRQKMEELRQRTAPFILRRQKGEVLQELPEKIVNIQPVDMTQLQEDSYRVVLDEVRQNLKQTISEKGFNNSRINVLAALTKLRQLCNHPALVLEEKGLKHGSGKMEALKEIVSDALDSGRKVIVFSQFVKMLKLIRKDFVNRDINFEYLDGSSRNRLQKVKNFNNNPEVRVFLISLKAGGLGLNLTAADIVIHVDPWWNPMVERQATDRAHRYGQESRVMVYKLITRGTVEEKMLKLQKQKQALFDNIVEANKNPVKAVTWEDIKTLLEFK